MVFKKYSKISGRQGMAPSLSWSTLKLSFNPYILALIVFINYPSLQLLPTILVPNRNDLYHHTTNIDLWKILQDFKSLEATELPLFNNKVEIFGHFTRRSMNNTWILLGFCTCTMAKTYGWEKIFKHNLPSINNSAMNNEKF